MISENTQEQKYSFSTTPLTYETLALATQIITSNSSRATISNALVKLFGPGTHAKIHLSHSKEIFELDTIKNYKLDFPLIAQNFEIGSFLISRNTVFTKEEKYIFENITKIFALYVDTCLQAQNVRQREHHFKLLTNSLTDLVVYVDKNKHYLFVNTTHEKWHGKPSTSFIGKHVRDCIEEGMYNQIEPFLNRALQGEQFKFETVLPFNTKGNIRVEVSYVPDILSDGSVAGVFVFVSDISSIREISRALQKSELRFKTLFEQSPLSTQVFSPDGKTLEVNNAWKKLWGVPEGEKNSFIFERYNILEDKRLEAEGAMPFLKAAFEGTPSIIPPVHYLPPEGSGLEARERWVGASISPVKDSSGEIKEVILVHHDVTDIKKAENELRHSRDQLDIILHGVSDGITVLNAKGDFIYANEAGVKMCGFESLEDFLNTSTKNVMEQFDIYNEQGELLQPNQLPGRLALQGVKDPKEMIVYIKTKGSNEKRWSIIKAKPIFGEDGKVQFGVSIFRDFTERKKAEDLLKNRSETNRYLADASKTLVSSLDFETTLRTIAELAVPEFADWSSIHLVNDNGELKRLTIAHKNPDTMAWAKEFAEKYPPNMNDASGVAHILRTGNSEIVEKISDEDIKKAFENDPEKRDLLLKLEVRSYIGVPLVARGKTLGVMGFVRSKTNRPFTPEDLNLAEELGRRAGLAMENARLYQEAQKAIRLRDDFLSIASHELKTPLTSLSMQLQIFKKVLEKECITHPLLHNMGDKSLTQANRLGSLIEKLLDVSRLVNGQLILEKEPVNLSSIIQEVVERFSEEIKNSGSSISLDLDPASTGLWDKLRVEQMTTNLISNALKYGKGGPITIKTKVYEKYISMIVADQGMGISLEDHQRVFNRFERAVSHQNISGLGIGLYITKQIIEAHHGKIFLESEPEKGSTFTVELPR